MKKENLLGKEFGRWLVTKEADPYISLKGAKSTRWECLCTCGNVKLVVAGSLKNGDSKSCGCLCTEIATKHEDSGSRLYRIWVGMNARCHGSSDERTTKAYKEKGITVCAEWRNCYTTFRDWALCNNYDSSLSIDRIDNNGNYEPDNCRWTTQTVQSRNTKALSSTNKSGYRGVSWNPVYSKWEVSISVRNKTVKVGFYDLVLDAAKAYDTYVKDNNLEHTSNGTSGRVEPTVGAILVNNNTSGYRGVSTSKRLQKSKKPWQVGIRIKKVLVFSGYYATPLEAAIAREDYIVANNLTIKRNFDETT